MAKAKCNYTPKCHLALLSAKHVTSPFQSRFPDTNGEVAFLRTAGKLEVQTPQREVLANPCLPLGPEKQQPACSLPLHFPG